MVVQERSRTALRKDKVLTIYNGPSGTWEGMTTQFEGLANCNLHLIKIKQ